jgi:hypothetical protein
MKFLSRVLGTWLLGLALILVIIDSTKSAASGTLTLTSFADTWRSLHESSWTTAFNAIMESVAPISGQAYAQYVFGLPGWTIFGVVGILLLLLGRRRAGRHYIETN